MTRMAAACIDVCREPQAAGRRTPSKMAEFVALACELAMLRGSKQAALGAILDKARSGSHSRRITPSLTLHSF